MATTPHRKGDAYGMSVTGQPPRMRYRPTIIETTAGWRPTVYYGPTDVVWESFDTYASDVRAMEVAQGKARELSGDNE